MDRSTEEVTTSKQAEDIITFESQVSLLRGERIYSLVPMLFPYGNPYRIADSALIKGEDVSFEHDRSNCITRRTMLGSRQYKKRKSPHPVGIADRATRIFPSNGEPGVKPRCDRDL